MTASPRHLLKDLSLSAIAAGFVTVLVGFASSAVIVYQAAQSLGASPAQISSWMWALGLGMGLTCIGLSLRYRMPVVTAWSTPGAAMLFSSAAGLPLSDAVGAFMLSALLICLAGFSGFFERMISRIPVSLASGMLAGVLLRFGLEAFGAMKTQLGMVLTMFVVYLLARRLLPRYAVILTLLVGIAFAAGLGLLRVNGLALELAKPIFLAPTFSLAAVVGIALPLFIVTMASQNVPGVAVIAARFNANAPNGASSRLATPVQPTTGEIGIGYPDARITATPGTFCEAIVTMNKGKAIPTTAANENVGVVKIGFASCNDRPSMRSKPSAPAIAMPTSNVRITA